MKIIDRYIFSIYLPIFVLVSLVFLIFFVVGDMFDISKTAIANSIDLKIMLSYFENIIPFYFVKYILPISNLLTVFISVGLLMKHNELIALRACGIAPSFIFRTIIIFSIILVALSIYLSIDYVPKHKHRARNIKNYDIKLKKQNPKIIYDVFLNFTNNYSLSADLFDYNTNKFENITITKISAAKILERIDAKLCVYQNNSWIMFDVIKRKWIDDVEQPSEKFKIFNLTQECGFTDTPHDIFILNDFQIKDKDEMTYKELQSYRAIMKKRGFSENWILTDLYYMFSFPFSNLILVLFALPIAIHSSKNNIAFGFGLSLMIFFCFWIATYICVTLGHREILSPFVATNITNFLFLILSIALDKYLKNRII